MTKLAKNEDGERKICCVRIRSEDFGRGDGLRTIDALLAWLDCDLPHFTVAETKLPAFARYRFAESWRPARALRAGGGLNSVSTGRKGQGRTAEFPRHVTAGGGAVR